MVIQCSKQGDKIACVTSSLLELPSNTQRMEYRSGLMDESKANKGTCITEKGITVLMDALCAPLFAHALFL